MRMLTVDVEQALACFAQLLQGACAAVDEGARPTTCFNDAAKQAGIVVARQRLFVE